MRLDATRFPDQRHNIFTPEGVKVEYVVAFDTETCEAELIDVDETGKPRFDDRGNLQIVKRVLTGHCAVDPSGKRV